MNLHQLAYRLQRAGLVCRCCGCKYGDIRLEGPWSPPQRGICHVCDAPGLVRPIHDYCWLDRGKARVRLLSEGIFDRDTILRSLDITPETPTPAEEEAAA